MRLKKKLRIGVILGLVSSFCIGQTTIELTPTDDARVWKYLPDNSYGSDDYIQTYPNEPNHTERFLIKFNFDSIPAGATITEAKLELVNGGTFGATRTLNAHKMNVSWSENSVTWNSSNGNFDPTVSSFDQPTYPNDMNGVWDLTTDVQDIINANIPNNGWIIKDSNEDNSQHYWKFWSSDFSTESYHPKMTITYTGGNTNNTNTQIISNQIEIQAFQDATINSAQPYNNYGTDTSMFIYPWGTDYSRRSLINFDLSPISSIPTGHIVDSIHLVLTPINYLGFARTHHVLSVNQPWSESSVNWDNAPTGVSNINTVISQPGHPTKIDVTQYVLSIVESEIDLNGFLIMDSNESDMSQQFFEFGTRENIHDAFKPKLIVYTSANYDILYSHCETEETSNPNQRFGAPSDYVNYVPDAQTETEYIRINVHFVHESGGTPNNFTKIDDGLGSNEYNGYQVAQNIIDQANERLKSNYPMHLPVGNNTPVIDPKVQYLLNGVFYKTDGTLYNFDGDDPTGYLNDVDNVHVENPNEALNYYFVGKNLSTTNPGTAGVGEFGLRKKAAAVSPWRWYVDNILNGPYDWELNMWVTTRLFNHEVGHNLSLAHTIINGKRRDSNGNIIIRCDYGSDGACTDTPVRSEIESYFPNFCDHCPYNQDSPECPSNLMGYNGLHAITPCQAGTMHWTIHNEMNTYRSCIYSENLKIVNSFTSNISHIAKTVQIPQGANVLVNQNNGLYIQAETFEIKANSNFEIKGNCQFRAKSVTACN